MSFTVNLELIPQTGTFFLEDNGIPGDGIIQVRYPDGTIVTFAIPGDVIFVTATTGQSLEINITEDLGATDLIVGSLTDSTDNPENIVVREVSTTGDVQLAANGSVTEGGADAGADVVAGSLLISAQEGIGAAGAAIETQTGQLEAETASGGIALANFGDVVIGGLSDEVVGLFVDDSGDLVFTNQGSITLGDESGDSVIQNGSESGGVTITASGANSDITSSVYYDAISTYGGNVVVTAGRDVILGSAGVDYDNDIRSDSSVTINAGRDFTSSGDADVSGFDGGVTITAGRDVNLLDDNGAYSQVTSYNGDVVITTGAGGTLTVEYSYYNSNIVSSNGDVTLNTDRAIIGPAAGILAAGGFGTVTIETVTPGRRIDLGSTTDSAFALELSDEELDRFFCGLLVIGRTDGGRVTVSSDLFLGPVTDLTLLSGEDIRINADVGGVSGLTLSTAADVLQSAASTIAVDTLVVSVDSPDDDPGTGQSTVFAGFVGTNSTTIRGGPDPDNLGGTNDDDSIIGGVGADIMAGLGGNDTYYADTGNDIVNETAGNGTLDVVFSSVSYALQAGSEIELLSAIDNSATTAIDLTGNELAQVIYGNAGVNVITGGGGADLLIGLGGDDLYNINDDDAVVIENTGGGADVILTSVSYQLGLGVEVEVLGASDSSATTAINLVGNELAQVLYGNNGVNVLVGGSGADTLVGFGGDDVYYVDDAQAAVVEATGGGNDAVLTSVSYTLGAGTEVELLAALDSGATDAIDLTGNELANILYGNAGANTLDGRSGADTLNGLDGADTFAFTTALGGGNVDALADFDATDDTIALDDAVFTALTPGALPAGAFVAGTAAADADDRIVYDGATGNIFYDADGNGAGAAVLFATVQSGTALTASDFTVI